MVTLIKYGALGGGEKYNANQMWIDGLSTDSKPTTTIDGMGIPNGSAYTEVDTGKTYMFDKENTTWYEVSIGGGGTSGGIVLVGETTTALTDNATTNPITVNGQSYTAQPNDAVIYGNKEFLFDGTKWHEFGDLSGLASKDIGAMTGYVKAQTAGAIGTSDTLNQAIGKVEKRVDDNENNILSIEGKTVGMGEGGSGYITINSQRLYMGATTPTGTIPDNSVGLFGGNMQLYGTDTEQLTEFPAIIRADGEPLIDYTIYGNTGGVGDEWDNILVNTFTDKTPQEANGLTITVSDGTITVDGTANANTNLCLVNNTIGSVTTSAYQVIEHGIYLLNGNPLDAAENKYILSYRYDPDGSGGTPSSQARVAVGQPSEIDNSTGDYTYIAMYFAIWSGTVCNNVVFTPSIQKKGYKIPITSGDVTTNLPVDSPLGLTDTLTYNDTGIAIPTFDGDNTISFGTTVQPSAMSAEYKGWHSQDNE